MKPNIILIIIIKKNKKVLFMEYTFVLIIHLLCAIIFIGFIFADVVVFPAVKK